MTGRPGPANVPHVAQEYDADVAVVGYGPTGVIAALTLARHGIRVVALEREQSIYPRARAVTVNDWTMRILQDLGVDARVEKVIEPQRGMRWVTYDGREVMRVMPRPSPLGSRARSYNIYQPVMEAELRRCVLDDHADLVEVRYGADATMLTEDAAGVDIGYTAADGAARTVRARYAIAADGGSSTVRGLLGIPLLGDTVDTTWIVIDCDVRRWWPDRDILTFWSDRERPVVDIALSAGHHRWEIPLTARESPDDYPTAAKVWPLLKALGHDERDVAIHQYAFYRHHVRMAQTWRHGRVFLAGDAAHLMPPWAGAGMQSGMRDAHNLGWKLARVLSGAFDERWLDTYEQERRPNVEFFTQYAVRLGRIIKQEASRAEIDAINTTADGRLQPSESERFLPPVLTQGWFRGHRGEDSAVGRMIPQPIVADGSCRIGRLDDLLGDGFVLLGADLSPATVIAPAEKAQWDALGARYLTVRRRTAYAEDDTDLIDLDDVLLPWMARYGARVIALRPDHFVAASDVAGLAPPELPCTDPLSTNGCPHDPHC